MNSRNALSLVLLVALAAGALFAAAPFALGSPAAQDATEQQATINALVNQRFTQTAEASGPALTATAEGALAATANADASATAGFSLTLDTAFNQALTATAQAEAGVPAQQATDEPVAAPTEVPVALRIVLVPAGDATPELLESAAAIIRRRLQGLGIPSVIRVRSEFIAVFIVPPPNQEDVIRTIHQRGQLEFVDFSGLFDQIDDFVGQTIATTAGGERDGARLHPETNAPFETVVTGEALRNAEALQSDSGWQVRFDFTESGGERMSAFTRDHIGEPLAITLDGRILSIPVIQSELGLTGGLVSALSEEDARRLALQLNFGALPIALNVSQIDALDALPEGLTAQAQVVPTERAEPTATPDPRPTATTGEIQVAEQVFENGRMFYVQPIDQIWVLEITGEGEGDWTIYPDTFEEGEPELDPSLVAPEGMIQPVRGFGKLWRENDEVREALGWALTPEFGYVSQYRYQPGGEVAPDGQVIPGPGFHLVFSLEGEAFRFNEDDNTWELNEDD